MVMIEQKCLTQARAFWLTQPLRYLVLLKYTHLYADVVQCDCDPTGESFGALVHYATKDVFWDQGMYPSSDRILIPTASDQAAVERLVKRVQQDFSGQALVLKFSETETRDAFMQAFRLQYARSLISYTAPHVVDWAVSDPAWRSDPAVQMSTAPDEAVRALYRSNGYTDDELRHYFEQGAIAFTLFDAGMPVCTCMAYQNFETVWEIGGLHTIASARRKGFARRVVETALALLAERALIPRYLVEESNTASLTLAESLGLQVGLRFEHYVMVV